MPKSSGAPGTVPAGPCHRHDGPSLLYVGSSPKAPPRGGGPESMQTLRGRVRYHFRGKAYGSTLRLTLSRPLAEDLGIVLRRVGSGTRLTVAKAGDTTLSAWMAAHARVG